MKTLILYVFHEFTNRVKYFIENGIFESENHTFLIIINNNKIPEIMNLPEYVKVLQRDNVGFDFGGWSDGLLNDDLYKDYDKFIFINSSCMGPFTPSYYSGNWCDIFTNNITDDIKLFGTSINNCNYNTNIIEVSTNPMKQSHIQSWVFCLDKIALDLLIEKGIFSRQYEKTHIDAINNREVPMSREIIKNGWNIGSLMVHYNNVDFRFKDKQPSDYKIEFFNDVVYDNHYFNSNLHPYEVIFVKDNRNINKKWLDVYFKKDILDQKVIKAIYGIENKYVDVTSSVNSFVGTPFKISNDFFGDPAPGSIKHLIILDHDNNILINMENNFYRKNYVLNSDTKMKYIDVVLTC